MDKEDTSSVNDKDAKGASEKQEPTTSEMTRESLQNTARIEDLRTRLYARGVEPEKLVRHSLKEQNANPPMPKQVPIERQIERVVPPTVARPVKTSPPVSPIAAEPRTSTDQLTPKTFMFEKKRRVIRKKLLLGGIGFFVIALGLSSIFLLRGSNVISNANISINVSGPLTVGGGEELELQIAVQNENAISIDAATLIIEYPKGTQASDNSGKELFTSRQQLSSINPSEVLNVPVRARIFGEENEEKIVNVSVEYRIVGSNATFIKKAEPFRFKVSSSPVVLSIDSVKSISSGQETAITLTVSSNSPAPLTNVLVKARYPETGFDFSSAKPEAVSGKDTWLIKELAPKEKKTITIRGIVVGKQDEERAFTFSVGVPGDRNSYDMLSVFSIIKTAIVMEQPFLDLEMSVNGSEDETYVLSGSGSANVLISLNNPLDDTLYNGEISVQLSGSALSSIDVDASGGFYDSSKGIVSWDFNDTDDLREIAPGRKQSMSFGLRFSDDPGTTAEIELDVTGKAQRIFEDRVPQELIGTIARTIRVESGATLQSSALYTEGPFVNSGPVPPVVDDVTTYTLLLTVKNGTNDITGAEVTAALPRYVTWLDTVSSPDDVEYNAVNRTVTWKIGDMQANGHEEAWMQVSLKPSSSQVNTTPTVLDTQRFKATNRFTGTVIRGSAPALTTSLFNDPDESVRNGTVEPND